MSVKMTTKERFDRMFSHREADRVPVYDYPWESTVRRWHSEGMPEGVQYTEYFDLDRISRISVDTSPRYEEKTLEETDEYRIYTTVWGTTLKNWKKMASTPEFLGFTTTSPDTWAEAKKRMTVSKDRVNWDHLSKNYAKWRSNGHWIEANLWFGFDVTHSWTVGTERFLLAIAEEPEWCMDMFSHYLDVNLALLDMVWEAGYEFDSVKWPDDMGYKNAQFFSPGTYREILKPFHKKAADWAHSHGIKAHLHSCGNILPFIPDLIDAGIDALNPIEVKAGMDPVLIKKIYGNELVLHGGINAVLWNDIDAIEAEIRRVLPVMKESGGYIFASDHSIPDTVSFENICRILKLVTDLGRY